MPARHSEAARINLSDLNHIQTTNTTLEAAGEGEGLRQVAATAVVCGDGTSLLLRRCKPVRSSRR